MTEPKLVEQVSIKSGDTAIRANRTPRVFQVQKSDDGITWDTVKNIFEEIKTEPDTVYTYNI